MAKESIARPLAQSYLDHIERATRVWEPTPNGWASRPVTTQDQEHWKRLAEYYGSSKHTR